MSLLDIVDCVKIIFWKSLSSDSLNHKHKIRSIG
jgi:hypothetical protein